jgi:hypothetical protein
MNESPEFYALLYILVSGSAELLFFKKFNLGWEWFENALFASVFADRHSDSYRVETGAAHRTEANA